MKSNAKITWVVLLCILLAAGLSGCIETKLETDSTDEEPDTDSTAFEIDTVAQNGEFPAIAIDNNGNPHISYLDYNDGYVKYAYKSGTTWTIENIEYVADTHGTLANRGLSSIALDAENNPHICYMSALGFDSTYGTGSVDYKYAKKTGATWTITIIPLPISKTYSDGTVTYYIPFEESSIVVDKTTGTAHVSFQMLDGWGYALGYWNTNLDRAIIVDKLDENSGWHNAIALDSNGFLGISYEARGEGNLKYAHWDGSAFDIETVAPMALVYWENRLTSLAIDKNNNPHIAYFGKDGDLSNYKYACKNGSSWSIETIPYSSGYPSLSLCLDEIGKLHIALVVIDYGNSYRLKHACWDGASWSSFDTIDDDVNRCAIAVDNSGKIHIIYDQQVGSNSIIKCATKNTGGSTPDLVVPGQNY